MARYRRYYRRYVRAAKKKWSSNATDFETTAPTVAANSFVAQGQAIVANADRIAAEGGAIKSSVQILKCSRFKFRGVINNTTGVGMTLLYFITYVPEGASTLFVGNGANDIIGTYGFYTHPEWVMAWGRKDYNVTSQSNELSLTTKLKRNLNSGDSIFLVICWINNSGGSMTAYPVQGTISYMCCAN